ncbi:MAG: efflux RND transporter permease subunit [Parcubacteria group bacterium]|nr:efflux RND transporter permease subunit [Parcubacteria group bacterium]
MLPIWNFFLQKRQFTILVMIGLLIAGTVSVMSITKESSPEVQIPVGIVSVALAGARPEEVERLVTNKIESRLANIADLNKLTSTSREGFSTVVVEFSANANLEKSIQKLKDEVDKVQSELPEDATDPTVTDVNFADQPIQIISVSADRPLAALGALGEELKNELQTVRGVSRVDVSGARDREISIVVKKEELARFNLSLGQVVAAVGASHATLPVGSITTDNIAYNIAFEGGLDEIKDLENLPVLNRNGQPIYLRDIATVSDGVTKATAYTRISKDGSPSEQALTLSVFKVRGIDVADTTTAVRAKLAELNDGILAGSAVVITNDAGELIQKDLGQLTRTGLETIALVMLCLFLTIGWRESVIAGLSIPLSFLIAFVALFYTNNTINFISLFSLILAIGILVDSGIVVVEAIHTRLRLYGDKNKAAYEALREYSWPLIGGTLATVAFFVPLFFISGIVGKFIATIPFTIIFVLMASIVVALGLVPTLVLMFTRNAGDHTWLEEKQDEYAEKARMWYREHLSAFLNSRPDQNRFLVGIIVGFVVMLTLPIAGVIPTAFFPQEDLDFIYVDIEMPAGTVLEHTDLAARAVEETLYNVPGIASFTTTVGSTNVFSNSPQSEARYANITINLPKERALNSTEVLKLVQEAVKPMTLGEIRPGQPTGGPPVGAALLVRFTGKDRDQLDTFATQARDILEKTPGAISVSSSNKDSGVEFTLELDRAQLATYGITPSQVAQTLRSSVSGVTATKLTGGTKDVDVVVSLNLNENATDPHEATHTTLDSLRRIPIATPDGRTVLIGSVTKEGIRRGSASIAHENRERLVTVTGDVDAEHTLAEVTAAFEAAVKEAGLPEGITMTIGGENEEINRSFMEMGFSLIAGLALTFVILVLSFNSYRFATYLLLTVPLSLIGVFAGLGITGQAVSFPSVLGVIALAGVIINHAIILMDSIIQRLKTGAGRELADIIVEASTTRLRPIFLTTITTVLGMIPLTYAGGLWAPLAWAILFGLSFAMILTLVFIPLLVYRWPGKNLPEGIMHTE